MVFEREKDRHLGEDGAMAKRCYRWLQSAGKNLPQGAATRVLWAKAELPTYGKWSRERAF